MAIQVFPPAPKPVLTDKEKDVILDKFDIDLFNGEATLFDKSYEKLDIIDLTDLLAKYNKDVKARLLEYYEKDGKSINFDNSPLHDIESY